MDTIKHSAPTAPKLPDHELIRRDAAAHPERTYSEHVEASRAILGEQYLEDLRRIQLRERTTS